MPLLRQPWFRLLTLALPLIFLAGCGGGGSLEGKVTFDGQPLDGGTITLASTVDDKIPRTFAAIKGGKYTIESSSKLTPGLYKVEINWLKKTGKTLPNKSDPGTTYEETQQMIPMMYNTKTELSVDVKSGSNTKDFDLKAGGPIDTGPSTESGFGKAPPKTGAGSDTSRPPSKTGAASDQSRPSKN